MPNPLYYLLLGIGAPGGGGPIDPLFSSVKLLLHLDGADGATTTTDNSTSAHPITFTGNAQIDTAQSKFGGSSLLLDGTGDYISASDSEDWTLGSGDFTIELWVRFNSLTSTTQQFINHYNNVSNQRGWYFRLSTANKLSFVYSTDGVTANSVIEGAWTPTTGVWYHVVAERSGSTLRTMADGAVIGSGSVATDSFFNSNNGIRIGGIMSTGLTQELNGWIDDLRLTKGVARYGGAYAVPTAPFPNS